MTSRVSCYQTRKIKIKNEKPFFPLQGLVRFPFRRFMRSMRWVSSVQPIGSTYTALPLALNIWSARSLFSGELFFGLFTPGCSVQAHTKTRAQTHTQTHTQTFSFSSTCMACNVQLLDGVRRRPFYKRGNNPQIIEPVERGQQPQFNLGNWLKLAVSVWTMTHSKKAPRNPGGTPYHFPYFLFLLIFTYLFIFYCSTPVLLASSPRQCPSNIYYRNSTEIYFILSMSAYPLNKIKINRV